MIGAVLAVLLVAVSACVFIVAWWIVGTLYLLSLVCGAVALHAPGKGPIGGLSRLLLSSPPLHFVQGDAIDPTAGQNKVAVGGWHHVAYDSPAPEGIGQVWKVSALGSKRTKVFGFLPDLLAPGLGSCFGIMTPNVRSNLKYISSFAAQVLDLLVAARAVSARKAPFAGLQEVLRRLKMSCGSSGRVRAYMMSSLDIWQDTAMPFPGPASNAHGLSLIVLTLTWFRCFNVSMPRPRTIGPVMRYAKNS